MDNNTFPQTKRALWVLLAGVLGLPLAASADTGSPVALAWDANAEATVTGYLVYVGTSPGVYTQLYDVGNLPSYTFYDGVDGHTYYFVVSAYSAGLLEGPQSVEISALVSAGTGTTGGGSTGGGSTGGGSTGGGSTGGGTTGGGTTGGGSTGGAMGGGSSTSGPAAGGGGGGSVSPASATSSATTPAPAAPQPAASGPGVVLQPATVRGNALTLQWGAVGGLPILEYVIEAGSGPGLSNVYTGSVGLATGLNATIGDGAYYVRVRARTGATTSVTSNEVSFSANVGGLAGCTAPPPSPMGVHATVAGVMASASWPPVGGATSYLVAAGSSPGLSDIFYGNVGNAGAVSAGVSPGFRAYVRVMAVNACGQSAASAEVFMQ